jgi:hypothetical protein
MPIPSISAAGLSSNMANKKQRREFPFIPRIINPVKVEKAVIFSAETRIRESSQILDENMPWLQTEILYSPQSVGQVKSNRATVFLFDDTALPLVDVEKIRRNNPEAALVLLSANAYIHCSPPQLAKAKYPYTADADLVFAYSTTSLVPPLIVTSVVRAAEDLINIRRTSNVRRFIFLVVDDEPRWLSQFLPTLYGIIGQRADVMITRTYEETLNFLFGVEEESLIDSRDCGSRGHGDDVVCLIADIFFPKGRLFNSDAGRDLVRLISRYYPRIPIIVASKAKEAEDLKKAALLLPKGDPGSLQKLKDYIHDFSGMGDFLICDKSGQELHRIKNIQGLYRILFAAEKDTRRGRELREILESYGQKDKFSTWLYMHSHQELGDILRPKRSQGRRLIALLKKHLKEEIRQLNAAPLMVDDTKVFSLEDLLQALRTISPDIFQPFSDNDIISSWLDWKGFSELAEELRPIHGSGLKLTETLVSIIERWQKAYARRNSIL